MNARKFLTLAAVIGILSSLTSCGTGEDHKGTNTGPTPVPLGVQYRRYVNVGGHEHDYVLFVPTSRIGANNLPLVISLHGGGSNALEQDLLTKFREKAATAGFALMTPNGYQLTWNAGACCDPAKAANINHTAVITRMLDDAATVISTNPDRIFATGHSNGGQMAYRLACELSDRIAAIAPNASYLLDRDVNTTPATQVFNCQPTRPVPVLHLHGLEDRCAPFEGGASAGPAGGLRPPVQDSIDFWTQNNRCTLPPALPNYLRGDARCSSHSGCQDGAEVKLCTVASGGHIWPGSDAYVGQDVCKGSTTQNLDATDMIWNFFNAHPRR